MVKGRRGYTLIEMVVVSAIVSVVSLVAATVMLKTQQVQLAATGLAETQQEAFAAFDVISRMIRQASADTIVIDRHNSSQPPWSKISFTVNATGRQITISQRDRELFMNNNKVFGNVRNVSFAFAKSTADNILTVNLTFEKPVGPGQSKTVQLYVQRIKIQNR